MNINKCHVNSDVQTRDKAFGTIFKMIRQCITVLRQNVCHVNVICQIDI